MKSKTETLLIILGGSVLGYYLLNKFVLHSFAAAQNDAAQKGKKKMMMDMKMMDMIAKASNVKQCICPDGTMVKPMAIPGMADVVSCPCMLATGAASGVTVLPQATGVRGNQLQTVPNQTMMLIKPGTPGTIEGLLTGGTAQLAESQAYAAEDDTLATALKNAGIGNAEQMKVLDAVKKDNSVMKKATKCQCPDGTIVTAAQGICNCGQIRTAGALGLNRNIQALPSTLQVPGSATLGGQLMPVPGRGLPGQTLGGLQAQGQTVRGQRGQTLQGQTQPMQVIPKGGVSPTNTGQVCALDSVDNQFKLTGTNTKCNPGTGITMARGMDAARGESTLPAGSKFDMILPATLLAKAYLAPSSIHGEAKELPLIPCDSEDIYDEYGSIPYPYTHTQDLVSQYDEDSHSVPNFIVEDQSYPALQLPISNYPKR